MYPIGMPLSLPSVCSRSRSSRTSDHGFVQDIDSNAFIQNNANPTSTILTASSSSGSLAAGEMPFPKGSCKLPPLGQGGACSLSPYSLAWEEQPGSICFRITLAQQCPGGATADPLGCCPLFESTLTKVGCFSVASLAALSALTLRLSAFTKLLFSECANFPC